MNEPPPDELKEYSETLAVGNPDRFGERMIVTTTTTPAHRAFAKRFGLERGEMPLSMLPADWVAKPFVFTVSPVARKLRRQ